MAGGRRAPGGGGIAEVNFPGHGLRRGGSSGGAAGPAAARTGALGSPRARGRGKPGEFGRPEPRPQAKKQPPAGRPRWLRHLFFLTSPAVAGEGTSLIVRAPNDMQRWLKRQRTSKHKEDDGTSRLGQGSHASSRGRTTAAAQNPSASPLAGEAARAHRAVVPKPPAGLYAKRVY